MAFYFRKSIRVGPLRFNLSKSGIGVSSGIPGFRIGAGPRGTYIHMGLGGLYYRQTLDRRSQPIEQKNSSASDRSIPSLQPSTHQGMSEIGSGCVSEMVDIDSAALILEIQRKQKRILWWPIVLCVTFLVGLGFWVGSVNAWFATPCLIALSILTFLIYQRDQLKKTVVLMYDLDEACLEAYKNLSSVMDRVANCGGLWHITAEGGVRDRRYHAGASSVVQRHRLSIERRDPPYVKTNLSVPVLRFRDRSFYCLPDRILVFSSRGVGAVDYDELTLSASQSRFIEKSGVPRDALVVDQTWQYVNKDGSPDRRFKDNRRIPICKYDEIEITSGSGIREVIQLSRLDLSESLKEAFAANASAIGSTIEKEGSSPIDIGTALFEILCCVLVADGRVSTKEKRLLRSVMSNVSADWTEANFDKRLAKFVSEIQASGYQFVRDRSLLQLPRFKSPDQVQALLKFIDSLIESDGDYSDREIALRDRIQTLMSDV